MCGVVVVRYAWERALEERVSEIRRAEVKQLGRILFLTAITWLFQFCGPVLIAAVVFVLYVSLGNTLSVEKTFTVGGGLPGGRVVSESVCIAYVCGCVLTGAGLPEPVACSACSMANGHEVSN